MGTNSRIRMKDLAEKLDVSVSTVSRAFTNANLIHPETRHKILALSRELNYRPNLNARALVQQRTGMVGFVLASFGAAILDRMTKRLEDLFAAKGYDLQFAVSFRESEREKKLVEKMISRGFDGIIVDACVFRKGFGCIERLIQDRIPTVILSYNEDIPLSQVTGDFRFAGYELARHLIEKGHRSIAFVANSDGEPAIEKGFVRALKENGIEPDPDLFFTVSAQSMAELTSPVCDKLLKKKVTAVFANCDAMAVSLLAEFKKRQIEVPADIALTGCGNEQYSSVLSPPLTTYEIFTEHFADDLVTTLLERMKTPDAPLRTVLLKGRLIPRESTAIDIK